MIQVDTREHTSEWVRIMRQFDNMGIRYVRSKLYVGDYMSLDNARLVVDRKKDLLELCGNVCQQHDRFRAELVRAQQADIQIVILVEHGGDIRCLDDVAMWQNPRLRTSPGATTGGQLYKALGTLKKKYGVRYAFCDKTRTGEAIARILGEARAP